MLNILLSTIKIVFLLGFLILIHEGGHFLVAKLCKVRVNEFAIGFGPTIWKKQGKETKYALRLIPLGGFCSMEGETEVSEDEGAFNKAGVGKRFAIVLAGAIVNIIFGLLVYFILMSTVVVQFKNPEDNTVWNHIYYGAIQTKDFAFSAFDSLKMLFTGKATVDDMMGPVGISEVVVKTTSVIEYVYILAVVSLSLGVTNLLPIPALDGGKLLLLIIEAIRRKPIKEETEMKIQLIGFSILIALSLYITFNDVNRII